MQEVRKIGQTVILTDREVLEASGVECVVTFDEDYVRMKTALGILVVEGKNLRIENLSKDNGKIYIKGEVSSVYYADDRARGKKGLFK